MRFATVVKAGWLKRGFFFQSTKGAEAGGRRKGWSSEWQEFRSLSHLVSFWPWGLYDFGCFAPPRISHWEKGGKKSHSRCLEAVRETCSYKHTFLLVLTCISRRVCSWKPVGCTRTHKGKCADPDSRGYDNVWRSSFPLRRAAARVLFLTCWIQRKTIDCLICKAKCWPSVIIKQHICPPWGQKTEKLKGGNIIMA